MAPGKTAVDFNAIINADRQRRKHQALAQEIFSKGRRSSAPGAGIANRKQSAVPSLASRIGVAKRTVSTSAKNPRNTPKQPRPASKPATGNVDAEWTHDLHSLNNPPVSGVPRGPRGARPNRNEQLYSALNGSASSPAVNSQFNIIGASKPSTGISIRGLAGPYIVVAKNLAPGTTVADIESAMAPIGGVVVKCTLIAERPKVIAEIEFETKEGADNVVETLDNQNADGNILNVYHKIGAPSSAAKVVRSAPITPLGPRADNPADRSDDSRSGYNGTDRYTPRERRRDPERDDVMDGSYGFEDRMETDDGDRYGNGRGGRGGLYSDSLIGSRGRGNSRDRGRGGQGRGYR
ncbi:hypothetical protein G7Y89_g6002 [Cudoniella acicularis]|uniref:RRM domain-containing protein n=1 Tax=Cudoniella acicularis TaxID=354080 RepID=A0A8H4W3F6_9HELO|nr:hypothetical protein G7Y89_g6002 [Cudoniella acicularis]